MLQSSPEGCSLIAAFVTELVITMMFLFVILGYANTAPIFCDRS